MKKQFKYRFAALSLCILSASVYAQQAPNITYSPTSNVFTTGSAITALTPTNSGGTVPATTYGTVSTYAGTGTSGSTSNTLLTSKFNNPRWTTIDYTNKLMYVADAGNNLIRKIDMVAGTVSTYSGTAGSATEANGTIASAKFNAPYAITYDGSNNLYVADYGGNTIRKIVVSTGTVSTIATGLNGPAGIVYDPVTASLYVTNSGANTILKMSTTGVYSVYAGSGTAALINGTGAAAAFSTPNGITVDASGNLFVADQNNNVVRKIATGGVVTTFATGFTTPRGIDVDISGNLYVSDGNSNIYLVSPGGTVTTIGTSANFNQSRGICVYKTTGDIYVADYSNYVIRKITGTGYLISPTLPTGLSFTNSTGKISGTPSTTSNASSYTVTAFNSSGSDTTTISIQCVETNNWTGAANNTLWANAGNWSTGTIPGVNDNVHIGVVAYSRNRQPAISATSTTVNSIVFGPYGSTNGFTPANAKLTVNGSTLTINSALTANTNAAATITGNTAALVMAPGSQITVNGTSLTISTNSFTLKSDITGSASIGPVTTTNFITSGTTVNVERYLLGGAGYRGYMLLSSPVNTGTTDTHGNKIYSINYLLDSVYTSGTGASFSTSTSKPGNPSMYLFRENMVPQYTTFLNSCFRGIQDMTAGPNYTINLETGTFDIPIGNGYLFYLRGGITSTDPAVAYTAGSTPGDATLTTTGTLNQGSITFRHWYTPGTAGLLYSTISGQAIIEGFNLVGNPYACTIDLAATGGISMTNISPFVYELDPITKNYGLYALDGSAPSTDHASRYIASGQGFFVVASGATPTPSLTFNESCKVVSVQNTGSNLLLSKAPVANAVPRYLRLRMALDSTNLDETIISFKNDAKPGYVLNEDALYHVGSGKVNIASLSSDNKMVAVNAMPLDKADSVRLKINAAADGTYTLNMNSIKGIPELYDIWLMDAYKKDSVNLRYDKSYSFDIIKSDTASFGAYRFTIIMRQNPARAYRLLNFTASKAPGRRVQLNWETENEANYTNFTVERSTNGGVTYTVVGGVPSTGAGKYGLLDKNPGQNNLYRLKQEDINNKITYSNIIRVGFADRGNDMAGKDINIYPNPAGSTVNITVNTEANDRAEIYHFTITNNYGFIVRQGTSAQTNWQANIAGLLPGTYIIQVINNKDRSFIGKSKLVKL